MKQIGHIANKLSELGYRLTLQRMMVLSAIENSDNHISAEEIYAQIVVKYPNVNISTVYRTLELLKRLNLVTETYLGDGYIRYHPVEKGHHHHLVCEKCESIIDIDESTLARLQDVLLHRYNFNARLSHLAIFGRCANCNK
jgi:Fur family ferric uptake transcriptional regulator